MGTGKLTDKQTEILEFIREKILANGYPPSVREICQAVGLRSTSSVHSHLSQLEEKGYIRRDPTKPRAIDIIDEEFALTRRELVNVPIVGTVAAGEPILATENITDYFPIPLLLKPSTERTVISDSSLRTTQWILSSWNPVISLERSSGCSVHTDNNHSDKTRFASFIR